MQYALKLVDQLHLPDGSRVLEAGCGAGLLTVELARRHYMVDAMDAVGAMSEATLGRARREGLARYVSTRVADVHALDHAEDTFDLVIALGVIPWLHSPVDALTEMQRVLKPGGTLIITSDNRSRLNHLMDPLLNPLLSPLRKLMKQLLVKSRLMSGEKKEPWLVRMYSPTEVDELIQHVGLKKATELTVGFGPFSFLRCPLLKNRRGIQVHEFLQRIADKEFPFVRWVGNHYIIVARKQADHITMGGGRNHG
jgi:ubiquinone/menaquinone biosynthesis C-methylase UbiE